MSSACRLLSIRKATLIDVNMKDWHDFREFKA
jgi:hypothetical protein